MPIARTINRFLISAFGIRIARSAVGIRIVRADASETELWSRIHAARAGESIDTLRKVFSTKMEEQASKTNDSDRDYLSIPARINGDWYWIPADVLPYIAHCETGELSDGDLIRPLEMDPWNYFQIRDLIRPGWTILDIGTSIGVYSVMMARGVGESGRVFAFEPLPSVQIQLREMLNVNSTHNVEVIPSAVADKPGELDFLSVSASNRHREGSSLKIQETLKQIGAAVEREIIRVPVTTVDVFVAERAIRPNLMKIDVEGADWEVIVGAEKTIRENHPVIQLELHAQAADALPDILKFLEECDYKITRMQNQLICV